MRTLTKFLTWKTTIICTLSVLFPLVVLNFYGYYTNSFDVSKVGNYIFPILCIVHILYLYVIWFKIRENELPDPKMRNIEYALYAILLVYVFKIFQTIQVLVSAAGFEGHVIPSTFMPMAVLTLIMSVILPFLTLYTFWLRKKIIGVYNFENYNNNLNIWQ